MSSFPGPPTVLIMAGTNDLGTQKKNPNRLTVVRSVNAKLNEAISTCFMMQRPVSLLCYGDSLTAGLTNESSSYAPYALLLEAALGLPTAHIGMSGWNSIQLQHSVDQPTNECCFYRQWQGLKAAISAADPGHLMYERATHIV